jgi:hypothetical protein
MDSRIEHLFGHDGWMAGGAYGRESEHGRTIGSRLGWDRPQLEPPRSPAAGAPRHCWVIELDGETSPLPGLLLSWERTDRGWAGVVVVAVPGTLGTLLRLPASNLRPVD